MSDREQLLEWQEAKRAGEELMRHLEQQEMAGVALARFCLAFLGAVHASSNPAEPTLTRDEALWLLYGALQGR